MTITRHKHVLTGVVLTLAASSFVATSRSGAHAEEKPVHASFEALPAPGSYALDPPHTFVYFAAQHKVVGMVRGRFDKVSGSIVVVKDPAACTVDVSIETESVDTQNSIRDADLRGADFFDAKKFPTIEYHGKGIRKSGDHWLIDGTVSIHGIKKVMPLEFTFKGSAPAQPGKASRAAFHATGSAQRADFGMKRELLDEIGKASANPDVWIDIDTEALAAGPQKP